MIKQRFQYLVETVVICYIPCGRRPRVNTCAHRAYTHTHTHAHTRTHTHTLTHTHTHNRTHAAHTHTHTHTHTDNSTHTDTNTHACSVGRAGWHIAPVVLQKKPCSRGKWSFSRFTCSHSVTVCFIQSHLVILIEKHFVTNSTNVRVCVCVRACVRACVRV